MEIRFYIGDDEDYLTSIQTSCLTFKVDDIIQIDVENGNSKVWNITPSSGEYKVLKISSYFKKYWPVSGSVQGVSDIHIVDVSVKKV